MKQVTVIMDKSLYDRVEEARQKEGLASKNKFLLMCIDRYFTLGTVAGLDGDNEEPQRLRDELQLRDEEAKAHDEEFKHWNSFTELQSLREEVYHLTREMHTKDDMLKTNVGVSTASGLTKLICSFGR